MLKQLLFNITDVLYLVNKPAVNTGCLYNGLYRYTLHQRIFDAEDPIPLRGFDIFDNLFALHQAFAIISKANSFVFQALTCFLNSFSKTAANAHDFTYALHLQAQCIIGTFKLIKIPAWYFYNYIVQRRLKVC